MKKLFAFSLSLVLVLALAGCGGRTAEEVPASANPSGSVDVAQPDATEAPAAPEQSQAESAAPVEAALIPGELFQLGDGEPVVRGLRLAGNRSGSAEFNSADPAAEGIRCIFELNEWVEVTPDADDRDGLGVWVFSHRDDPAFYASETLSEETPGFAGYSDLKYPADNEDPDNWYWGSFYLNPEDCEAGYYDLVFTLDGDAAAVLLTRFYTEYELEAKTDAELVEIMNGLK